MFSYRFLFNEYTILKMKNWFIYLSDEVSPKDKCGKLLEVMQVVSIIVCSTRKRKKAEWVTEELVQLSDKKEEFFQ